MLCAATAGLLSSQGLPAPAEPPQRFASWDEVNVLAHGLLQLGHGLREHMERTRGQLGSLERRLGAYGAVCEEPGASAAHSHVPATAVSRGEAASDTLRSLQVRATRSDCLRSFCSLRVWKGVDRRGAHPGLLELSCLGVKG